jgi:mRNA interferase MazF
VARFVKGDVVVVPFPFSDLSQTKRRPAVVVAALDGDDVILCQITSRSIGDRYAISLQDSDFQTGKLNQPSNVRPNRVFTADSRLILYRAGNLTVAKLNQIVESVCEIIHQ